MYEANDILNLARRMVAGASFHGLDADMALLLAYRINAMLHAEPEMLGYQGWAREFDLLDAVNDDALFDSTLSLHNDYLRSCGVVAADNMLQIWEQMKEDDEYLPIFTLMLEYVDFETAKRADVNPGAHSAKQRIVNFGDRWPRQSGKQMFMVELRVWEEADTERNATGGDIVWNHASYSTLAGSEDEAVRRVVGWYEELRGPLESGQYMDYDIPYTS